MYDLRAGQHLAPALDKRMRPVSVLQRAEHFARGDAAMTGHARRWQPGRGSHASSMATECCDCSQQAVQPKRGSHAQRACSQNGLNCKTRERRSRRKQQLVRLRQPEDLLVTLSHYARRGSGDGLRYASRDAAAQTSEVDIIAQCDRRDPRKSERG